MLQNFVQAMPAPGTPDDIRKTVLKLRWIGLHAEAEQLQRHLSMVAPDESVVIAALDTD